MSFPNRESIAPAVVNTLNVNMELHRGERLLVLSDVPRLADWQTVRPDRLQEMVERAYLGRLVADIARDEFPTCHVRFLPFPATGVDGTEPDDATAAAMRDVDVLLAITTYSLSHTDARENATDAGARVASMPGFEASMFEPGGPMAADYQQIAADCQTMAELLTPAEDVTVRTPYGTDLRFSLAGRAGRSDHGLYGTKPGLLGNLPAGEAYIAPVEGSTEGQIVVPAGWYPDLDHDMTLRFERGEVVDLQGGGAVGDHLRSLLQFGSSDPQVRARRNLAELGIGTNPNARRPDNVLESEKIKGTVHLAIGDSIHMGGQVAADLHDDFVQPQPDLILDDRPVIVRGEWRV